MHKVIATEYSYRPMAALPKILLLAQLVLISFPAQLQAEVVDGANGGNKHFYFLPPLVPKPSFTGVFDGSLEPIVEVCEWDGTECVASSIVDLTIDSRGRQRVRAVPEDEHYIVNLDGRNFPRNSTTTYRSRVLIRLEGAAPIEVELGRVDVTTAPSPIIFRIEEGAFLLGDLPSEDREKIAPVIQEHVGENLGFEPFRAIINLADADEVPDPQAGFTVLNSFGPTLPFAVVEIESFEGLENLASDSATNLILENKRYDPLATTSSQELIGQPIAAQNGYTGAGVTVAVLDSGIDLTEEVFGDCPYAGAPNCRVKVNLNMNPYPALGDCDSYEYHGTWVSQMVLEAAPDVDIIMLDVNAESGGLTGTACGLSTDTFLAATTWILENGAAYNVVAANVSFAQLNHSYSHEDCPSGRYQISEWNAIQDMIDAGVTTFIGSGNDGLLDGVSYMACIPTAVSVGSVGYSNDEVWHGVLPDGTVYEGTTRGANLDFLAPDGFSTGGGTSLATPMMAGAWAVMRSASPELTRDETLGILESSATPVYDPYTFLTFPRLQLDAALRTAGLPIVEGTCPCFTSAVLNAIEWDIWCTSATTFEYLLEDAASSDPGPIVVSSPGSSPPSCSTGSFYSTVTQDITSVEAAACAALIVATGTNQGTRMACRID